MNKIYQEISSLNDKFKTMCYGLTQNETEREIGIPILSDIPLIGPLFINRVTQKEIRNLVIFVTPTIVRTRAQGRSLFQRIDTRMKENDGIFKKRNTLEKRKKKSTEEDD